MTAALTARWDAGADLRDVGAWRADVLARLADGARLVTLFGRPEGADALRVTAVLQDPDGQLGALRTDVSRGAGFHTLSEDAPAASVFERELHEQWDVPVRGHAWLKPIRFERGNVDDYPFLSVHGKQVHEVQVGPIHAGVIEPGAFRFSCHGEVVFHLEIHLGYQHRGVEAKLLAVSPWRAGPLVEVIAGDTTVGHAWAWAAAVEALAGAPPDPERDAARRAMLELERAAMHLAGLSGMALDVGFLQGATTYGRLRTTAINAAMRLCGSRFGRTAVRAAGSGVAWDEATRDGVLRDLAALEADARAIDAHFLGSASVLHRLRDTGPVSAEVARALGLVGPAARASGIGVDQRVFTAPGFVPVVAESGDCFARADVRVRELHASLASVRALLGARPVAVRAPSAPSPLAPDTLAVAVVEGWRGEVVHALETGPGGALRHYKVQDPSLRNWMGLALALRGQEISDFPICNKSFDLSYCGNDL